MAKRFDTLRAQMAPEAQAQAARQAQETFQGMPETPPTPGQVAYEAYVAAAHPVVGDALMRWEDTNMRYRAIWEAAAQAVVAREEKALRLYRYGDAPPALQACVEASGDEEFVVLVPPGWREEAVLDTLPHTVWDLLGGQAPHDEWGYVQRQEQPDGWLLIVTRPV